MKKCYITPNQTRRRKTHKKVLLLLGLSEGRLLHRFLTVGIMAITIYFDMLSQHLYFWFVDIPLLILFYLISYEMAIVGQVANVEHLTTCRLASIFFRNWGVPNPIQ
jgi:hypothetical protein